MFGRHLRAGRYPYVRPYLCVRPSSASRSPSAYSALCCGQIAYPRAHIDTPGTKLSQHAQKGPFQPVLHEQGELSTAPSTTTPSRENFVPCPVPNPVQNSPNTPPPAAHPVQNSPCSAGPPAHPVQNSPSAPVLQRFHEKVRPVHPTPQQNRGKVRPAHLKTAFFASFAPAGRIFSRSHPHQAEQGELIRAEDLTGRDDGATLKPPTPLFTVDRPRSSHRLYGRHPRPRTRSPDNDCHHNETRI